MIRELSFQKFMGDIVTVSIGVATYSGNNLASYEELLHLADNAMYQAKQTRRGAGLPDRSRFTRQFLRNWLRRPCHNRAVYCFHKPLGRFNS